MEERINLKESNKNTSLFVQVLLVSSMIICAITSIFLKEFILVVEILAGLTLISMAYNNKKIFKRRFLTGLYVVVGVVVFIISVWTWIGEYIAV